MLNKELYLVFLPAMSWLLFSLGGTQISGKTPGWKGWRRFILPACYIAACLIAQFVWWRCVLVGLIAWGAYSLPYGHKTPYKIKALVGIGYGLISIPIGLSVWNALVPAWFLVLFLLSNTKITARTFAWKICEGSFGLMVGISLGYLLSLSGGVIW